jgi:metal-sulfur cluster biosynthetic enzyme
MMDDAHPTDTPEAPAQAGAAAADVQAEGLSADLVKLALRRVKDPEVNLNIVDMGLIYDIRVAGADVAIDMSLTTPACPSGPQIMEEAEREVKAIEGIGKVELNLVWSPPWGPQRIEPRVRAYLGF